MRSPGSPVRVVTSKWGDRPHWEFDAVVLGSDELGTWVGAPAGTHHSRPGMAFDSDVDAVTLLPSHGWYAATLYAPGIWCQVYVDIATPAVWSGDTVRAVDLDLDVIRMAPRLPEHLPPGVLVRGAAGLATGAGEVFVDDEDEFAEHRVAFGYPAEVVVGAERACHQVRADVAAGRAPYDEVTAARWFAVLGQLVRGV